MKHYLFALILICVSGTLYAAEQPVNLDVAKDQVKLYHDSGEYNAAIDKVVSAAQNYLAARIAENAQAKEKKKLAIVLDVDETSLSNYQALLSTDFGYIPAIATQDMQKADDPAIQATLNFYKYARANNVAVFFITGREELLKKATVKNLHGVGYTGWNGLYFRPMHYEQKSVIPYKSSARAQLEKQGYDVVLSLGDQNSDLAGGFDDASFKLPDPYYYIP